MNSSAALAASLIRKELRASKVPGSVTSKNYAGGCSVNVKLVDPLPATRKAVDAFACQFQYGTFDGMTDSYSYTNRRDDIPQVSYVFVEADYSDALRADAWDWCRANLAGFDEAPETVERAYTWRADHWGCYGSDLVWQVLAGHRFPEFWTARKPRVTVPRHLTVGVAA